jgi:hypothetical protein
MTPGPSDPPVRSPGSWRRRWFRRVVVALALASIAGFVWVLLSRRNIQANYEAAIARLDRADPGWRLEEMEAAREAIPDEENSARVVVAAHDMLPSFYLPVEFTDAFAGLPRNRRLRGPLFGQLCNELNEWEAVLVECRKLAAMPRGRHRISYAMPPMNTLLADQFKVRYVAFLLLYDAMRRADEGDLEGALLDCGASVNAGRSIGDEPLVMSQLHRIAGVRVGCYAVERTLAQGEPNSEALAVTQRLLETENAFGHYLLSLRCTRAQDHETYLGMESGAIPFTSGPSRPPSAIDQLVHVVQNPELEVLAAHPHMLEFETRWVEAAKLPETAQSAALHELFQQTINVRLDDLQAMPPEKRIALVTLITVPGLKGFREFSCRLRSTILCLALERYRQKRGRWPDSLTDLVPEQLAAIPADPFDGEALRYALLPDGVFVYSLLHPSAVAQGADLADLEKEHIGFRLWSVERRRQEPPPE